MSGNSSTEHYRWTGFDALRILAILIHAQSLAGSNAFVIEDEKAYDSKLCALHPDAIQNDVGNAD